MYLSFFLLLYVCVSGSVYSVYCMRTILKYKTVGVFVSSLLPHDARDAKFFLHVAQVFVCGCVCVWVHECTLYGCTYYSCWIIIYKSVYD